jgi:hypothetical protein
MDMPDCLRHMTRSLAYVSCVYAGTEEGTLTDDGATLCSDAGDLKAQKVKAVRIMR